MQMINIPFYDFIIDNPENGFAIANYILGRLNDYEILNQINKSGHSYKFV